MSRTKGHKGCKSVFTKQKDSHSSNKENKVNSHRRRRTQIRGLMSKADHIDIDISAMPSYDHKKMIGCCSGFI